MQTMNPNDTITLDPSKVEHDAMAFGILVRALEEENANVFSSAHSLPSLLLYAATYFLGKIPSEQLWLSAMLSTMNVIHERKLVLGKGENSRVVSFPDWDPDELASIPHYPLADAFLSVETWRLAMQRNDYPPEDYLGPLFSIGGYVLDGIKKGHLAEEPEIQRTVKDFLPTAYKKLPHPETGPKELSAQLSALDGLYAQFVAEKKREA